MTGWRIPAAAVLAAVLVSLGALANGFVLDDRGVILSNPIVTGQDAPWRAFVSPYWPEAIGGGQYRPLAILSFALDWKLSGGAAWWFHLVNIAWHALVTALVVRCGLELFGRTAGMAAGLIFAVHPVHVEAVANVVGRSELMAAAFLLAALLWHRRGSWLAAPAFALALLAKEHALVFLALAALHDVRFPRLRPARSRYIAYGATAVLWGVAVALVFRGRELNVTADAYIGATTGERLITVLTVLPHYARLLVAPWSLSSDYSPQVIPLVGSLTGDALLGLLLLAVTVAAVVQLWKRSPAAAFAFCWIPVAIAPVSNVLVVTGVTMAERTLYLASAGAAWLGGAVMEAVVAHRRTVAWPALGALLLAFGVRSWTRTLVWRDDRALVLSLLESHPESYRGHWIGGRVLAASGNVDGAAREFAIARSLFQRHPRLYRESAEVALARGDTSQARALADSAYRLAPDDTALARLVRRMRGVEP